jgi:hypothetical protein
MYALQKGRFFEMTLQKWGILFESQGNIQGNSQELPEKRPEVGRIIPVFRKVTFLQCVHECLKSEKPRSSSIRVFVALFVDGNIMINFSFPNIFSLFREIRVIRG